MEKSGISIMLGGKLKEVRQFFYLSLIKKIFHTKFGRDKLIKGLRNKVYKSLVEENTVLPKKVAIRKYQFLMALLECTKRNIDKGFFSTDTADRVINSLIKYGFTNRELTNDIKEKFKEKYGILPPSFIVLSPTQRCNLNCVGCYASSKANAPSLPFEVVDKIVDETYNEWGNRFMTISGGEPFMYNDNGKTLFDIWKKYNEMFFLVYTNGTLITKELAKKLAELGNVTPAISVEGFEDITDERRGKGIFKKILEAMKNLREAGVPFGVSITATQKNFNTLINDKFYDFIFKEQGANYIWMFQLMPIGQARNMKELMITPEQRVKLLRKWEFLLSEKKYCIADFWNSGVLAEGCIAYGRDGGYLYVDWNGNITPCVFIPYYKDNIIELYKQNKKLAGALFSDLFINGRKWQKEYALSHLKNPDNWLMPCSIRDHWLNFKNNILGDAKPEDEFSKEALESKEYTKNLEEFDNKLEKLTKPIWEKEYLEEKPLKLFKIS